jgi:hypothetical protein
MAPHNRHGRYGGPNKYERKAGSGPERVAEPTGNANLPVPVNSVPSLDFQPTGDWLARRPSDTPTYLPTLGESWRGRRQGQRLINDLRTATAVANAGAEYHKAAERLEEARQSVELTAQRRNLLPLRAAHERFQLEQHLAKAETAFEMIKDSREQQRIDHARQRDLDQSDFELARLQREADKQELAARIAAAEAQLSYAPQIGQRRGEAELARTETEALRHQADVEAERRRLGQELRKRRQADEPDDRDEMPEPLARHFATERRVKRNTNDAARRAQDVRDRAAAKGRELTDAELEEIDMLVDAASAAEGSIRRGEASDLEE